MKFAEFKTMFLEVLNDWIWNYNLNIKINKK